VTASQPSTAVPAWRVGVIGAVGALAVGMGVAVGGFLLEARGAPIVSGASYVPATAPFYVELRLEPSAAQDASLRELLGRFPEIEGVDLERPLYEQLGEVIDEAQPDTEAISWSEDIDSWFDGSIGLALLDIPTEAMAPMDPMDPMAAPPIPSMVGLFGVSDRVAAEAAIGRLRADAAEGLTFTEQVHGDATIHVADDGGFAYSLVDDQLIVAPAAEDIVAAIDAHTSSETTLSEAGSITELTDALPADWLAFMIYDLTDLMAAAFQQPGAMASPGTDALRELMEHQSLRGAMAVTAGGDRVAVETVTDAPTGPLTVENADRGLADEVPADALYYADGGNLGEALTAVIGPLKDMFGATGGEEQLGMIESALGGDLEELVAWMDDGATVVGWDGEAVYGGMLIVPTDADEARRRLGQIETFAGLAAMDPASGITVETRDAGGEKITSIRWIDPNAVDPAMPSPVDLSEGVVVEWTVTEDRALIGVGDQFVERVLDLDPADSLAIQARYADAIDELGGASNAGATWLDLRGIRLAVESAVGTSADEATMEFYTTEIAPWLEPLDRVVGIARLESELLVSTVVLLVE
jgi:hypothetical protein